MKFVKILIMAVTINSVIGCASLEKSMRYNSLAKRQDFSFFFSSASDVRYFSTIEEASDFVQVADAKIRLSSGKTYTQGLNAKLRGTIYEEEKRVVVVHYFGAFSESEQLNLSNPKNIERQLNNAISVASVYLVFFEGKGISISNFYLASGYEYTSNSQIPNFTFSGQRLDAEYPVGWTNDKAFEYLKEKTQ